MRYLFIIEKGSRNYGGYFPDVPGCVATAKSVDKLLTLAREALEFHLEDETELPRSRTLRAHLAKGLKLGSGDMIAWVEFEPRHGLVTA
jgi:predicted RNase H-like HicB family nuclease